MNPPSYYHADKDLITAFFGPHRFLSNFWPCRVRFGPHLFQSVEAAYQAMKSPDRTEWGRFVMATPSEAKKMGKSLVLRSDWDKVRRPIMQFFVAQKFFQNYDLGKLLVETGTARLEEGNGWMDDFWGVAYDKDGKSLGGLNHLGEILMDVRSVLVGQN